MKGYGELNQLLYKESGSNTLTVTP